METKMKKLLIGLSFLTLTFNAFALNGVEIYDRHSSAVIYLEIETNEGPGHGTGFFIHESGLIFTNKHMIHPKTEDGRLLELKSIKGYTLNGTDAYEVQIIAEHEIADVALLKVEKKKKSDTILKISKTSPKVGEEIFLIGNPKTMSHSLTSGILSFVGPFKLDKMDTDEGIRLQHTAPTLPGSSGSPILNKDGEVIGIHNSGFKTTQGFNFGYHSVYLKEMLDKFLNSNSNNKKEPTEIVKSEFKNSTESKNDLASLIRELKAYTPPEERKLGSL
jgi:S1-C subfamily serine protease